ncbi:hypothetical protein Tco_0867376, partial [Tanacetum coccineum]
EKLMLVEAQEAGQILDEEQLAFIADPGIKEALSDYDDISLAKAVLMENLSSCDSDVIYECKKIKRLITKESESSKKPSTTKETPKGKGPSKGSKTGKSTSTKEPVEEPIDEVVTDGAFNTADEDVVHDDDQPQDTLEPKTNKTLNQDWFKQPPRLPTPDPE